MDRNREAFRNRFLAYKNGKSVREIYGIPEYQSGKVNYSKWDAANTLSYIIPFIKEKAITLTDAGRATGAKLSTNLLDSLADNAVRAEVPIRTAIGLATKESTLGNPTDDRTAWNLSSAIRELFDGLYPGTVQHINNGTNIVQGDNLINYHKGNINTSVFNDNTEKSVLQEGLEFYKQHPDKYNPGQPGYQKAVETRGNEVMKSPEVKKWYKEWEAKQVKVMRPNPYSLPTIQSTAPKKFGKYADGKLPRFANGTGEVLNNISEEYTPLASNVYQPMVTDAKQQIAKFAVDDYAYRVQKQHPEITKELLLGIYNSTPYIGSDSRKGSTVGQYWHGEDDGYGRRVMVYPRSMKSDDPEFNLQDRILSTVLHESNHLLRDVILGGKYTDKEREYLLNAYPGVPINEAAALNALIREKLSKIYGNGAVGEKLDATLEKLHKNKGMLNEMMFHLNNLNGYGHADKVNGSWDPKLIDAMINALMNVASVQHKPKNGLLLAKDGKLPEYRRGKLGLLEPDELIKIQPRTSSKPVEPGLGVMGPIEKGLAYWMGGRILSGAAALWNTTRQLKQRGEMYRQARLWNDLTSGASRAWKIQDADKIARGPLGTGDSPLSFLYDTFGSPLVNAYDKLNLNPVIGMILP